MFSVVILINTKEVPTSQLWSFFFSDICTLLQIKNTVVSSNKGIWKKIGKFFKYENRTISLIRLENGSKNAIFLFCNRTSVVFILLFTQIKWMLVRTVLPFKKWAIYLLVTVGSIEKILSIACMISLLRMELLFGKMTREEWAVTCSKIWNGA